MKLLEILEIEHVGPKGEVLWRAEHLTNVLHAEGEEYILTAAFYDEDIIPSEFYFGCDDRLTLSRTDTMDDVVDEPQINGYARQVVAYGEFAIETDNGFWGAVSPILIYTASGGDWGPVSNLFLTTESGGGGKLIASVPFSQEITVENGTSLNVRMRIALQD